MILKLLDSCQYQKNTVRKFQNFFTVIFRIRPIEKYSPITMTKNYLY